jgi:hypothetical protein
MHDQCRRADERKLRADVEAIDETKQRGGGLGGRRLPLKACEPLVLRSIGSVLTAVPPTRAGRAATRVETRDTDGREPGPAERSSFRRLRGRGYTHPRWRSA